MTPAAARAERTARRWLAAAVALFALWVAAHTIAGVATDARLPVPAELLRGPLCGAWLIAFLETARRRGWAAGYEAAQPRPIPDERTRR